jgi:hypothetical protein
MRRRITLTGATLACAFVAATATAAAGGHVHGPAKGPSCSALLSLGNLKEASKIPSLEKSEIRRWNKKKDPVWQLVQQGSLPGQACYYSTSTVGVAYPQLIFSIDEVYLGYVVVGYGESANEFKQLLASQKAFSGNEPSVLYIPSSSINGNGAVKQIHLGAGSQAFLIDFDLVAAGEANPVAYPQFPTDFYVIDVRSRLGNVVQIADYGASQKATEGLAKLVLNNPKF